MKIIYTSLLFIAASTGVWAQKTVGSKAVQSLKLRSSASGLLAPKQSSNALAGSCDTINFPIPDEWNFTAYLAEDGNGNTAGFVTGNDIFGDLEKAAYFDASATVDNYLTKVWIGFAVANSNRTANLAKVVPIRIYDGTTGEPGTLLTTVNKTLSDLKADVDAGNYTEVNFSSSLALPASKKFFISVDLSNLVWSTSTGGVQDSLAIYASDPNNFEPAEGTDGFGWEYYQGTGAWETFFDGWGNDYALVIHPFLCTDAVFPVRLLSFSGSHKNDNNIITWTTASESGNAGFVLQRSPDGASFTDIARIASKAKDGNSSVPLSYSYTDLKGIAGNQFYRLKQTDRTGKENYSSVINIQAPVLQQIQVVTVWPNPAISQVNLLVSSPASDKIQMSIVDMRGKTISQKSQQVSAGDNTINLGITSLAPGSYFIKIASGSGAVITKKFVKE